MSGFLIVQQNCVGLKPALDILNSQCEGQPFQIDVGSQSFFLWPGVLDKAPIIVTSQESHVAIVGTIFYQNLTGQKAAEAILRDINANSFDEDEALGTYCLIVVQSKIELVLDRIGSFSAFTNLDHTVWSSSFLAVAMLATRLTIDTEAAYEYVFQGTCYGAATPVNEIRRLSPSYKYNLTHNEQIRRPWNLPSDYKPQTFEEAVEACLKSLDSTFGAAVQSYGDKINMALTGGYDSRLMLAQLRKLGSTPTLHVYGKASDPDVVIAKAIANGENLPLVHTEKKKPDPSTFDAKDIVEENYRFFDGWPVDGIFDSGVDKATRLARAHGGVLSLNGGAGGMFRNAYYIRDTPISINQMLGIFYTQFDPSLCRKEAFSLSKFYENLGMKLRQALDLNTGEMTRVQVEQMYPLVRCRFWMGRNTTINTRIGPTLTPFVAKSVVETASRIPLNYKNFGRLEAAMIERLDPKLANYVSDYGHSFRGSPPLKRIFSDTQIHLRPVWLRRRSYGLKHRLAKPLVGAFSVRDFESTFACKLSVGRQMFHLDELKDVEQLKRIATLDYLFAKLNIEPRITALNYVDPTTDV